MWILNTITEDIYYVKQDHSNTNYYMQSWIKFWVFINNYTLLTCDETYSMQSSNLDNIGIKPSLFTDKVGEFSFCKNKIKTKIKVI